MGDLTPRQSLFVSHYLVSLSPADAYLEAGYKAKTRKAASDMGLQLLDTPRIRAAVQEQLQAREARTLVTQDRVIQEYARLAFSDMRDYVEWGPDGVHLKPSSRLTEHQARAVLKVSERITKEGSTVTFELANKQPALHDLAQNMGMFPKESATINVNVAERIETTIQAIIQLRETKRE